jgi:hypothetical protein
VVPDEALNKTINKALDAALNEGPVAAAVSVVLGGFGSLRVVP